MILTFTFRKVKVSWTGFDDVMNKLKSSSFKGVFIISNNEMLFINQNRDFNFTFKACKESFVTISVVMYFRKNFFLANAINQVIGNLQSGGLIEHWHFNYIDKMFSKILKNKSEAQKLTIAQIVGCFQLWAGGCLIAALSFMVEITRKL